MKQIFYIESLGDLYTDVQASGIFNDSKFFVDCMPKMPGGELLLAYNEFKKNGQTSLLSFVQEHFIFPAEYHDNAPSNIKTIDEHIKHLWLKLEKPKAAGVGTLLPLNNPYIVPGGRFREVYYWDSYFTMLGLMEHNKTELAESIVQNFADQIHTYGFIPNGNRSYYLTRSQPPFFSLMVDLIQQKKGNDFLIKQLAALEKEYDFWMDSQADQTRHKVKWLDGIMLNRYADTEGSPRPEAYTEDVETGLGDPQIYRHLRSAAESGWDFSSRWLANPHQLSTIQTCNIIPLDLNCLLYYLELKLAEAYTFTHEDIKKATIEKAAAARAQAVQELFWNDILQTFCDLDLVAKKSTGHLNLAMVYPLFFKIATPEQAVLVAKMIGEKFLKPGGVVTTLCNSGQQWDAPNGWAPLQYMSIVALKNYGYSGLADKIKLNWLTLCENVFTNTGKMMEKYDVEDVTLLAGGGEYPNQDGFGWTNGVYVALKAME